MKNCDYASIMFGTFTTNYRYHRGATFMKFQIERKNFRKMKQCLYIKIIDQKGEKVRKKENVLKFCYQKQKWQFILYFRVQSGSLVQILSAS